MYNRERILSSIADVRKIGLPQAKSETRSLCYTIQKIKVMASSPITSWQVDGETIETVTDFIFGGLQTHYRW